jgi:hypothetical protein
MNEIMSACFTFVQMTGGELVMNGHYTVVTGENRITVHRSYRVPALTDATSAEMWMQMAAAKLCDSL